MNLEFDERGKKQTDLPPDVQPYVLDDSTRLAVNVALATNRPLLLRGDPGAGKSTLARFVAWSLDWDYDAEVITSRTQAQDLLYRFDVIRRLSDHTLVRGGKKKPAPSDDRYVEPGVLWRAFDPSGATKYVSKRRAPKPGSVVLLDEIDKADPDVPNDLLVVIESQWFHLAELRRKIVAPTPRRPMLVAITTNGERELPRAFIRRCIACDLARPSVDRMAEIARAHYPMISDDILEPIKSAMREIEKRTKLREQLPSTAEFLDAVRALQHMREIEKNQKRKFGTEAEVIETALWKFGPGGVKGA